MKNILLFLLTGIFTITACGPSHEEKAESEQALNMEAPPLTLMIGLFLVK